MRLSVSGQSHLFLTPVLTHQKGEEWYGGSATELGPSPSSPSGEPGVHSLASTGGKAQRFQFREETVAHSCPGLDQIGKPLGKHFPGTGGHPAKKLAYTELEDHSPASARHVVNCSLIQTMDTAYDIPPPSA